MTSTDLKLKARLCCILVHGYEKYKGGNTMGSDDEKSYDDVEALCPFFIKSGKANITCEGLDDYSRIKLLYVGKKGNLIPTLRDHKRFIHCNDKYNECPIFKMLMKVYEEKQNGSKPL